MVRFFRVAGSSKQEHIRGKANYLLGKIENLLGGLFGAGLETNVKDALTFLTNNFKQGDKTFVLGFSRGAATAEIVCNIICRILSSHFHHSVISEAARK